MSVLFPQLPFDFYLMPFDRTITHQDSAQPEEGFWHKAGREIDLFGAGLAVPAAAKDQIVNQPVKTAVEFAASVALSGALVYATQGQGLGTVLGAATSVGFVAGSAKFFTTSIGAFVDNWHSAEHWQNNAQPCSIILLRLFLTLD